MRLIKPRSTTVPSDRIVRRFEASLKAGRRPSIEDALDSAAKAEWGDLLRTLLTAEINARRTRGETPLAREYLPRFPAHTDTVLALFPEDAAALSSQDTVLDLIVAPVPIPLTKPVDGPLPQAIVLGDQIAVRPASPPRGLPRWTRWLVAAAVVLFSAMIAVVALVPPPKPEEPPPASVAATPPPPPSRARLLLKPPTDDPERDFAEWVTALGGRGTLLLANGGRRTFGDEITLPKMKFSVTGVSLPAEAAAHWVEADLDRLRGRSKLTAVQLYHPTAITDSTLEPLFALPLTTLDLYGHMQVTGVTIARFPDLETLALMSSAAFTDADFAEVARLKKLRSLSLNTYHLSPKGLAGLRNPDLRSLRFGDQVRLSSDHIRVLFGLPLEEFESHAGMTDDVLLEFAVFPHIKAFRFRQTGLTDAGLKALLGHGHLEEFRAVGSEISGPGLEYLEDRNRLRVLDLSGGKVKDAGLEFLVLLPALREVRLAGCPITDQGGTVLAQIEGLQTLDLSDTDITDATVKQLRKHPTLRELILVNTNATADWVRDFERVTPNCRVVWSPKR